MREFDARAAELRDTLVRKCGYVPQDRPVDIGKTPGGDTAECCIIAGKANYNILYAEAGSNWKSVASAAAREQNPPCMVFTRYDESRIIVSTKIDYEDPKRKSRFLVIDHSTGKAFQNFLNTIKVTQVDTAQDIDTRVREAFDGFAAYKDALKEFSQNLKTAIYTTRKMIKMAIKHNVIYKAESKKFLEMCRSVISDKLQPDDVTEMILQHVMTYRIFSLLYDEHELHSTNAVARSLEGMVETLEIDVEGVTAGYRTIKLVAESITETSKKQDFLKLVYETFYAEYDPKNKDSWGIAYTPSEVVDFMVRSTEYLLKKHFKKSISDECVTILDPATGTGTFITSVLKYLQHLKPASLERKYTGEIFANDISILAYYIAALNIENTYREITGNAKEFENICWMDTLTTGSKDFGKVSTYFESQDNVKRISRQQIKDICVVIGNPPYNAVQVNFNDVNPADKYPDIDAKISNTYMKNSTVKYHGKSYDMYQRFIKWSSERIKRKGMVVFVTNNSFLDAKSDDGFRRSVFEEFDYIYTVNLKGNARTAGDAWKREGAKIFGQGARVGIAISFFIKTPKKESEIHYSEIDDYVNNKEDKLKWLEDNSLSTLPIMNIKPDEEANWINQTDNDFDELIPIYQKGGNSIFGEVAIGASTNRDEWVYDFNITHLENKMRFFIEFYNKTLLSYHNQKPPQELKHWVKKKIKWSSDILKYLERGNQSRYTRTNITDTLYRPFVSKSQYFDKIITERPSKFSMLFRNSNHNKLIGFPNPKTNVLFHALATNKIIGLDCISGTQCIPLYTYDDSNKRHSNITKFGRDLFQKHHKKTTVEDIFYYTYAIFNDPKYREKYKYNLQRKFPRIPLAKNFEQWVKIGRELYNLHVGFEREKPHDLGRIDVDSGKNKTILSLKTPKGPDDDPPKIIIDKRTTLTDIPELALQHTIGSKCALEWVLEFYKESKNRITDKSCDDPKIRERFNMYRFEDHKERVIDLLKKVTTVSVETVRLQEKLRTMEWGPQPELNLIKIDTKKHDDVIKPPKPDRKSTMALIRERRRTVPAGQKSILST